MNYEIQPNTTEIWKDVESYETLYQVSTFGRIKRLKVSVVDKKEGMRIHKGGILVPHTLNNRYKYNDLSKDGKEKRYLIHRLVALTFIPNPEGKSDVNHKDGNPANNNVDNLEWMTRAENNLHAFRVLHREPVKSMFGRKGKLHHCSKPIICINTNQQFECITTAAKQLGLNRSNISKVLKGTYTHVGGFKFEYYNN